MTRSGAQREKNSFFFILRLERRAQPASGLGGEWANRKDPRQGIAGQRENKFMEGLGVSC